LSRRVVSLPVALMMAVLSMRPVLRMMRVMVANPLAAAFNRADLMTLSGRHAAIMAALHAVALVMALALAAGLAGLHADVIAMLFAVALCLAAPVAVFMLALYVFFAVQPINAGAVIGVIAGRLMTAERIIAPEQTAHAARSMRIGIGAQIGIAAAALRRIAEMLLIALADHMLRRGIAVFAHRLMLMRAHLAGIVVFHAAGCDFMLFAVAGIVSALAARCSRVIRTVGYAMAALAAGCVGMLGTVAGIVSALAAGCLAVIRTVTAHVTSLAAGRSLMLHAIAGKMTFLTANRSVMVLSIRGTVFFKAAGSKTMRQLITGIVFLGAA